jgi:hypothetical protein
MSKGWTVTITCPVCGLGELEVAIDPGEPMVMYYPDGSGYPGSPAGPEEIISSTCECSESSLVDQSKFWDAVCDSAMSTPPPEPDHDY